MNLYSYKGQEPQILPEKIRLENGNSVTSLNELSNEELLSYGFVGPISKPTFNGDIQKLIWDCHEYKVEDLSEQELLIVDSKKRESIIQGFRITDFWVNFKNTSFHYRLRKEAAADLKISILYSEFISLSQKSFDIDEYLIKLFLVIDFTEQEVQSLSNILDFFKLDCIPNAEYLSNHYYDFDTNSIVDKTTKPFASWLWNGTKWEAPVAYPTDGGSYVWNEKIKNWKKI